VFSLPGFHFANLPLYAGYWWDDAIGLYHVRHRVYRPEWGRWLQRDPLGYAPGWNLYQYVNGQPWGAVDPMGLADAGFLDYLFGALEVIDEVVDAALSPLKGGGAPGLAADMERGIRDKEEIARDLADSPYGEAAEYYVGGLRRYQKAMGQAADMAETAVLFTIAPGINIESGAMSAQNVRRGSGARRFTQGADVVDSAKSRTAAELVQETATRANRWGSKNGLSGKSPLGGSEMHRYADNLLTRYQQIYGDRGLTTEVRYIHGTEWKRGMPTKRSVILDVVEGPLHAPTHVFDYKFGRSGLSTYRINQIRCTAGFGPAVPITEVRP
jgi:RHS repeat-associated protein